MGTDMQGLSLTGSNEAAVNYDRANSHLVRFQIEVIEAQVSARAADPGSRWRASLERTCR